VSETNIVTSLQSAVSHPQVLEVALWQHQSRLIPNPALSHISHKSTCKQTPLLGWNDDIKMYLKKWDKRGGLNESCSGYGEVLGCCEAVMNL